MYHSFWDTLYRRMLIYAYLSISSPNVLRIISMHFFDSAVYLSAIDNAKRNACGPGTVIVRHLAISNRVVVVVFSGRVSKRPGVSTISKFRLLVFPVSLLHISVSDVIVDSFAKTPRRPSTVFPVLLFPEPVLPINTNRSSALIKSEYVLRK